jgi:two-component system, cell cycle response regulator CpdR
VSNRGSWTLSKLRLNGTLCGWDLARLIREKEPTFPVIYVTGSNTEEWASRCVPHSVLIPKPFECAQLVRVVSNLLSQNATERMGERERPSSPPNERV